MATSEAIKLEREKRKTQREDRLWSLLQNSAVVEPVAIVGTMLGTYYAGKSRLIDRDLAGALFALEGVLAAARYGVNDRYALLGLWASLAGMYSLKVPVTDAEAMLTLEPFGGSDWSGGVWSDVVNFALGSDKKLFGLSIPYVS